MDFLVLSSVLVTVLSNPFLMDNTVHNVLYSALLFESFLKT